MAVLKLEKATKETASLKRVTKRTSLRDTLIQEKWKEMVLFPETCNLETIIKDLAEFEQAELFKNVEKGLYLLE